MGIKREEAHKSLMTQLLLEHSEVREVDRRTHVCTGETCKYQYTGLGDPVEIAEHQADVLWKEGIRP